MFDYDGLEKRVLERYEDETPRELWYKEELMFEAYYMNKGGCPSGGGNLGKFQSTVKMPRDEVL